MFLIRSIENSEFLYMKAKKIIKFFRLIFLFIVIIVVEVILFASRIIIKVLKCSCWGTNCSVSW